MGRYGNEEEAAYAYNDAIREAGLEGVRKVNPIVDGKLALKPPLRDPTAAQQSKYWGVTWARKQSKQCVSCVLLGGVAASPLVSLVARHRRDARCGPHRSVHAGGARLIMMRTPSSATSATSTIRRPPRSR